MKSILNRASATPWSNARADDAEVVSPTLAAFGDTFGSVWAPGGNGNDWHSQVLLRSNDTSHADGISFQIELFRIWTDNGDMWVQVDDYSLTTS